MVMRWFVVVLFCKNWGPHGVGPRGHPGFCLPTSGPPACALGIPLWAACSCSVGCVLLSRMFLCFCLQACGAPGVDPRVTLGVCLPGSGPPACTLGSTCGQHVLVPRSTCCCLMCCCALFCRHWGAPVWPRGVPLEFFVCPVRALLHAPWGYVCGWHVLVQWSACCCLICCCFLQGLGCPWGEPPGVAPGGFCLPSSGPPACTLGVHLWAACFLFGGVHAVVSCVAV